MGLVSPSNSEAKGVQKAERNLLGTYLELVDKEVIMKQKETSHNMTPMKLPAGLLRQWAGSWCFGWGTVRNMEIEDNILVFYENLNTNLTQNIFGKF